jgi:hypothetical protein
MTKYYTTGSEDHASKHPHTFQRFHFPSSNISVIGAALLPDVRVTRHWAVKYSLT